MRRPISFFGKPICRSTRASEEDFHRRKPSLRRLEEVFCLEAQRALSNDWGVRYRGRLLQIQRYSYHPAPAQAKVIVGEWESGKLEIRSYPEVSRAMVNNFAARKAVEKTRGGKVKNRLSPIAWKSRQHPRDSHFPAASAASVYMTNSYRTEGDISKEVRHGKD